MRTFSRVIFQGEFRPGVFSWVRFRVNFSWVSGSVRLGQFQNGSKFGQGLGLGSARVRVAARAQLGFGVAWVGSVGRVSGFGRSVGLVGLVGSGRSARVPWVRGRASNRLGSAGHQVGQVGELLRGRGRSIKSWGVPNN